jgi:hypothetical protein
VNLPHWEGWHLIGRYESDVGSWLLHHKGEALLLEVPEGPARYSGRSLRVERGRGIGTLPTLSS